MATYIVEIEQEHLETITREIHNKGGQIQPWNLTLGKFGHLKGEGDKKSLNLYMRLAVASNNPEMRCPHTEEMPGEVTLELLKLGADSYEWMNEGYLDHIDLTEAMRIVEDELIPRTEIGMDNADAKVRYLKQDSPSLDLPDWDEMTQAQKSLLQEAFSECRSEWQQEGRLNSHVLDLLKYQLRNLE